MQADLKFTLELPEKRSTLMRRLVAHWADELARLRAMNDGRALSEAETAFLRGRIQQVKENMELAVENRPMALSDEGDA